MLSIHPCQLLSFSNHFCDFYIGVTKGMLLYMNRVVLNMGLLLLHTWISCTAPHFQVKRQITRCAFDMYDKVTWNSSLVSILLFWQQFQLLDCNNSRSLLLTTAFNVICELAIVHHVIWSGDISAFYRFCMKTYRLLLSSCHAHLLHVPALSLSLCVQLPAYHRGGAVLMG